MNSSKNSNVFGDVNNSFQNDIERKSAKFASIPIGVTQGQFNINSFNGPKELKSLQMHSACLLAFCFLYFKDPLKWTTESIDNIIQQSTKLVRKKFINEMNGIINCTIVTPNCKAKVQVQEPSIFDTIISNTSLYTNLQIFFQNEDYALFRCSKLCYLLWKCNEIYFVFDSRGQTEARNGVASLICMDSLNNLSLLIKTISGLQSDDCYSVSGIKMKDFEAGLGLGGSTKLEIQFSGNDTFTVVTPHWALLRGKVPIGSLTFKSTINIPSMTVALMALLCKDVQLSNSWSSNFVDKIIVLGTALSQQCDLNFLEDISINHLPREYSLHNYKCQIEYTPFDYTGTLNYSMEAIKSDLFIKLRQAFENNLSSVMLQVRSLVFAVWLEKGFFYMFDGYARNESGYVPEDRLGKPCVHMHSTLVSLCSVLCENLKRIAPDDQFVLHGVKVALKCACDESIDHNKAVLLDEFMDDLSERKSFLDLCDDEVCNLDEESDDNIFNGIINQIDVLPRRLSYTSTISKRTSSTISESSKKSIHSIILSPNTTTDARSKTSELDQLPMKGKDGRQVKSAEYLKKPQKFTINKRSEFSGQSQNILSAQKVTRRKVKSANDAKQINENKTKHTIKQADQLKEPKSGLPVKLLNQNQFTKHEKTTSQKTSINTPSELTNQLKQSLSAPADEAIQSNKKKINRKTKSAGEIKESSIGTSSENNTTKNTSNDTLSEPRAKIKRKLSTEQGTQGVSRPTVKSVSEPKQSNGKRATKTVKSDVRLKEPKKSIADQQITAQGIKTFDKSKQYKKMSQVRPESERQAKSQDQSKHLKNTKSNMETKTQVKTKEKKSTDLEKRVKRRNNLKETSPIRKASVEKHNRQLQENETRSNAGEEPCDFNGNFSLIIRKTINDSSNDDLHVRNREIVETKTSVPNTDLKSLLSELRHEVKKLLQITYKFDRIKVGLI